MPVLASPPLRLTEDQMNALLAASKPLPADVRSAFLEHAAQEIAALPEVGDGALHRVVMRVQRLYFDPPHLSHEQAPRSSSRRKNGVRASEG
jgi:hypothetical protein